MTETSASKDGFLAPRAQIELLSVALLDQQRPLVLEIKRLAKSLGLELGWHYLLDLTWIIRQLDTISGKHIIDAGAGTGILQWFLAENGATVYSIDRDSRASLPRRFRLRYHARGLRPPDLLPLSSLLRQDLTRPGSMKKRLGRLRGHLTPLFPRQRAAGNVIIYNQNLASMDEIPSNSIDAIVSISALEHNTPEGLQRVVTELLRVLKPGAPLLATLTAAPNDAWHAPSSGWLYSDSSLRRLFDLGAEAPSNYSEYPTLMGKLEACAELRENLANFYFTSENNGMPWGKWDPQYLPVGVCKVKEG